MQGSAPLFGVAERPVCAGCTVAKENINLFNETAEIDDRVTREDLRQPLGEIAGQAVARSLMQQQFHDELVALDPPVAEFNVIGAFGGISEEGVKKIV